MFHNAVGWQIFQNAIPSICFCSTGSIGSARFPLKWPLADVPDHGAMVRDPSAGTMHIMDAPPSRPARIPIRPRRSRRRTTRGGRHWAGRSALCHRTGHPEVSPCLPAQRACRLRVGIRVKDDPAPTNQHRADH